MSRAVSIHIGVNHPRDHDVLLRESEASAWRMAELANQVGYDRILLLRGCAATRQAVHEALAGAAGTLQRGDTLLVSFSGHGTQEPDRDEDEGARDVVRSDEGWCLHDAVLLDDQLLGYWRLFEPGVRIVVVSESCFSGGMGRTGDSTYRPAPPRAGPVMRGGGFRTRSAQPDVVPGTSCIGEPPRDACEIRASVLMLTASTEAQPATDGLFTRCLLDVWAGGTFDGSYCALYLEVQDRVRTANPAQEPQILMLGCADPQFPVEAAFRVGDRGARARDVVYR
jgi:hypothetical protein